MKSVEGLMLTLALVAGAAARAMGLIDVEIASSILSGALVGLVAMIASVMISNKLVPEKLRSPDGWTAGKLFSVGSKSDVPTQIRLCAAGAALLMCISVAVFGFWAGFVAVYSMGE